MKCLIIAGGSVDTEQLKKEYRILKKGDMTDIGSAENEQDSVYVITCDRGTLYALEAGIPIDRAVGDFDSVSEAEFEDIRRRLADSAKERAAGEVIEKLIPEKDDTDSEHAIMYAFSLSPEEIVMMGFTGSRLDHTIASIDMLKLSADRGIPACILDKNNRVRIFRGESTFYKKDIFGKYVSIIPYGEEAYIEEISGFKYEVKDLLLEKSISRGISNELEAQMGIIKTRDYVLVLETKD